MGHSIHTMPYTLSAICPVQWKSGLIREEYTSPDAIECEPEEPDTIECEHLTTQVCYDDKLQSGRDPDEDDEHTDELPWDSFWQFVQKLFGYANRLLQQLS